MCVQDVCMCYFSDLVCRFPSQGMGLVNNAFPPEDLLKLRYGNLGIGHTRYSTTGISELQNCQPFVVDTLHGKIAVAHNGELVNAAALRKKVGHAVICNDCVCICLYCS